MAEDYPFPVPESSFVMLNRDRTPLWRRYIDDTIMRLDVDPLALRCIEEWIGVAKGLASILHQMCQDGIDDPKLVKFGTLDGLARNLMMMIDELEDIHAMAQETLPFDPVNQEWTRRGRKYHQRGSGGTGESSDTSGPSNRLQAVE